MPQFPQSQRRNCYTGITMPLKPNEIAPAEMVSRAGLDPGSGSLSLQVTDFTFPPNAEIGEYTQTSLHGRYVAAGGLPVTVRLGKKHQTIIDSDDVELVSRHRWRAKFSKKCNSLYA